MTEETLVEEIRRLKAEKNAVIVAHNYQRPEIQDLADFVGDSLELSRQAAATDAAVIVFCGVAFMAETAAILAPEKTVLHPDPEAGCSLAASITAEDLRRWRAEHEGAVVVSYVNTTAEVKALSDYCCTSANAVKVIQSIPEDKEILFLPDFFLGTYLERVTGRRLHLWLGECHVHAALTPDRVEARRRQFPDAEFLVHPECGCVSHCLVQRPEDALPPPRFLSTSGMIRHARTSSARRLLIATEEGILHRLRQESPEKEFIPIADGLVCHYMKRITLEKVYEALRHDRYVVRVEPTVAQAARRAIERMLAIA